MKPGATESNSGPVAHENLRTLCVLRLLPLVGMFFGAWFLLSSDVADLHWNVIFGLLASFILVISLTWLRSFLATPISHGELFSHLLVDIGIYSLLMFNTGGAGNPFIFYLLVPITVAAIALPRTLTAVVGITCLGSYTVLLFWYVPLPVVSPGYSGHAVHGDSHLSLHIVGMWLNFMISALLIAYFISRMSRRIAAQNLALQRQQQRRLEDEQLLAVATLAASAAHELGTPLNTIKLIGDEWQQNGFDPPDTNFRDDLKVLNRQMARCQETLRKLSQAARNFSGTEKQTRRAVTYFSDLVDNWRLMRPEIKAIIGFAPSDPELEITYHPSLSASILNLLNNAADASPRGIEIRVEWNEKQATLSIRDYGEGVEKGIRSTGPVISDKPGGMGLGLYLARTILARHGANLALEPQSGDGGTLTTITLPMKPADD